MAPGDAELNPKSGFISAIEIFQQLTCLRNNAGLKPENRALVLARDRQTR